VPRQIAFCLILGALAHVPPSLGAGSEPAPKPPVAERNAEKKYTTESLSGKVVWLSEALKDRFGIRTDDDVAQAIVVLETAEGQLHPLLKDARGRGFHTDERLRGIDMELLVRRYRGSPMVQVVRVYTLKPDGKYELDYWCDVCSIAMYELKPCECCQGTTRLRERLVEKTSAGTPPERKCNGSSPEKPSGVLPEQK
jgi:hypothetical protein